MAISVHRFRVMVGRGNGALNGALLGFSSLVATYDIMLRAPTEADYFRVTIVSRLPRRAYLCHKGMLRCGAGSMAFSKASAGCFFWIREEFKWSKRAV